MNTMTKLFSMSLLLAGAAAFFAGCGPENFDASLTDEAYTGDVDQNEVNRPMMMEEDEEGAMPARGNHPHKVAMPPVETVVLPEEVIQLPSRTVAQPPVVSYSREDRLAIQPITRHRNTHILQPNVNEHLIAKHLQINNKYQDHVFYHPSYRNDTAVTSDVSQTNAVLPTTFETLPAVTMPGRFGGFAGGGGFGFGRGCAPWLSGGFWRYCNPGAATTSMFPVVGPYYR